MHVRFTPWQKCSCGSGNIKDLESTIGKTIDLKFMCLDCGNIFFDRYSYNYEGREELKEKLKCCFKPAPNVSIRQTCSFCNNSRKDFQLGADTAYGPVCDECLHTLVYNDKIENIDDYSTAQKYCKEWEADYINNHQ